jgi:energy-coupling factor transport system permease protein
MNPMRRIHPMAWIVWSATSAVVALLVRNPYYLLLLALATLVVARAALKMKSLRTPLMLFASMLVFPTLLNLIFSRTGQTVLLQLPLRLIGGPYTLEALLFGLTSGLQIATLFLVMWVFSQAVTPLDLLRRMPPGFSTAGVMASIGMTFAPQARQAFDELQEARLVRGYQAKGLRDLPLILTPMVILSLESAHELAEGLAARGFGSGGLHGIRRWLVPAGWVGLALSVWLWVAFPGFKSWVGALVLLNLMILLLSYRSVARAGRYRPDPWRTVDTWLAGLCLGLGAVFLLVALLAPGLLSYYPYPAAVWPSLNWPLAVALLLAASPILGVGRD